MTSRRFANALGSLILGVALLAACSSDTDGRGYLGGEAGVAACPHREAVTCPSTPPSYAADVAPILDAHCAGCHNPSGENPDPSLDTYANVNKDRKIWPTAPENASNCAMPPPPLSPLSSADVRTLQCFFSFCSAAVVNNQKCSLPP